MQPGPEKSQLAKRLAVVRLAVFDVDGTLTDGRVQYLGAQELQSFDVRDGLALSLLRHIGVRQVWISGRGSDATRKRAEELGVDLLHLQAGHKGELLSSIQERFGVSTAATLAMGDDLPDLRLFSRAGVCACPSDAAPEVRRQADIVTSAPGGRGAAREVIERLARAMGLWQDLVDRVGGP
jgi:3-deoxy-D-manno-octulosonate 8-phosphate phosphatase (KDO 8-P phosphatase)